mgnify:FL=1
MFNAVASLMGYLMNFIYGITQNYGLAIILFTILIKLLLLPLTIKQQKSLAKTQELQPLVQELQRKYGNDQQKFAEEYQKLLKEKNMNMMSGMGCSGCLIQLIQIPIIFGMLYMMASPLTNILKLDTAEIEKYKQEVQEIKKQEAIVEINNNASNYTEQELNELLKKAEETDYMSGRYYEIEILDRMNIIDMDFLGINLCDITIYNKTNWVLWIIPVLSCLCTFITTKLMPKPNRPTANNAKPEDKSMIPSAEDMPMPDMRVMNAMMPIMTGYVAAIVPQGVGLYWVTSNLIGVIQQVVLKKKLPNTKKDV